jgi:predicted RND superfamily exporter protein
MVYEMQQTFDQELILISLLTAGAIFVVVALVFRSLIIPAILVLLVQCGVFITVCIAGIQGMAIYFLALLIVECILMGAMIDYAILFTNYYREKRQVFGKKSALRETYKDAIHTIMTSGSIIVIGVGIVGFCFDNPVIAQICIALATGAFCALVLVLFILPGLLSVFDRLIIRKPKEKL